MSDDDDGGGGGWLVGWLGGWVVSIKLLCHSLCSLAPATNVFHFSVFSKLWVGPLCHFFLFYSFFSLGETPTKN